MNNKLTPRFIIVIALFLAAILVNSFLDAPEAALKRTPLSNFPESIGEWTMVDQKSMDKQSLEMLNVDDYLIRTYRNRANQFIGLYIGYFLNQKEGKGIHSPRQCLPGAGWTPLETSVCELPFGNDVSGGRASANRYLMSNGDQKQLYIFWYQGRGRSYANEYCNKLYLVWDGLTKRRTDGALVRINVDAGSDPARAFELENAFIRQLLPIMPSYIPE